MLSFETGKEKRRGSRWSRRKVARCKFGVEIRFGWSSGYFRIGAIDCLIMTQRGQSVAVLKSLSDDMHVETRISHTKL